MGKFCSAGETKPGEIECVERLQVDKTAVIPTDGTVLSKQRGEKRQKKIKKRFNSCS